MSDKSTNQVETTGHVWDDDLAEYNNPLPRWWVWIFYISIVFSIGYMIAYPAIPLRHGATQGVTGYTIRGAVEKDIAQAEAANADIEAELAAVDLTALEPGTPLYNFAIQSGAATFATWCSQCHGSGAAGAKGYPNLLDNDWLWGGTIDEIAFTVAHGVRNTDDDEARYSEMPAFGDDYLSDEEITDVVAYVRTLSGLDADATAAAAGETVFADNCSSCHGEDGTGDREQGAPNLTDAIWLYGSDPATIEANVRNGPFGVMPAWHLRLSDSQVNGVAAYVHQLGGGE